MDELQQTRRQFWMPALAAGFVAYQVTLDGLGKAAATQRWQVNGIESAAADPSLCSTADDTSRR